MVNVYLKLQVIDIFLRVILNLHNTIEPLVGNQPRKKHKQRMSPSYEGDKGEVRLYMSLFYVIS